LKLEQIDIKIQSDHEYFILLHYLSFYSWKKSWS